MSRNPYVRPISKTGWWTKQPRFIRYMAREVTCIFIGFFCIMMLHALCALSSGAESWNAFVAHLQGGPHILILTLILAFSLYHTISWFSTVPQAMPIQVGEKFLPGGPIIAAHYAGLAIVTLVVLWLAGGF